MTFRGLAAIRRRSGPAQGSEERGGRRREPASPSRAPQTSGRHAGRDLALGGLTPPRSSPSGGSFPPPEGDFSRTGAGAAASQRAHCTGMRRSQRELARRRGLPSRGSGGAGCSPDRCAFDYPPRRDRKIRHIAFRGQNVCSTVKSLKAVETRTSWKCSHVRDFGDTHAELK